MLLSFVFRKCVILTSTKDFVYYASTKILWVEPFAINVRTYAVETLLNKPSLKTNDLRQ